MTPARWQHLMDSLGFRPNDAVFTALCTAYGERHRHYHTAAHILDCLEKFALLHASVPHPDAVELAIWFHDVVYNPYRNDNEARSAQWAGQFLHDNAANTALIERTSNLILATCHDAPANDPDAMALIDIDLSILGSSEDHFSVFEQAIRREYRWVPGPLYRRRRGEILQSFLDRKRIFLTDDFHHRYEAQARVNLANTLAQLRSRRRPLGTFDQ